MSALQLPPKLSIILPSYNPGDTLFYAINSILNQTFVDYELIVLDDGSTDDSLKIAMSFNDPRIKIYSDGMNRGLSYRLNQGVSLSQANYIARMDADDICFPERLELQFDYLSNHPEVDLVSSKAVVFNNAYSLCKILPYRQYHRDIVRSPWKTILMPHPTWMGKASWFKKNVYKDPEVLRAEDQELLLRTYPDSIFYSLPYVLLAYRQAEIDFLKKFTARKSLLSVQIEFFVKRSDFFNLMKSLGIFLIKVLLDFFSFLNKYYFLKKRQPILMAESLILRFDSLVKAIGPK